MGETEGRPRRDLLSLFSNTEIKGFFKRALLGTGVLELAVLLVALGHRISTQGAFPWKAYFLGAFTLPLLAVFLLLVYVMAFNLCLRDGAGGTDAGAFAELAGRERKDFLDRLHVFFHVVRKMPFLLGLAVAAAGAGVVYKLDAIFGFIARVGERTANLLLIAGGTLLGAAVLLGVLWLVFSYRLRKRTLDQRYQYRIKVAETMKLVILEDDTVLDAAGRVVSAGEARALPGGGGLLDRELLPTPRRDPPAPDPECEPERATAP